MKSTTGRGMPSSLPTCAQPHALVRLRPAPPILGRLLLPGFLRGVSVEGRGNVGIFRLPSVADLQWRDRAEFRIRIGRGAEILRILIMTLVPAAHVAGARFLPRRGLVTRGVTG